MVMKRFYPHFHNAQQNITITIIIIILRLAFTSHQQASKLLCAKIPISRFLNTTRKYVLLLLLLIVCFVATYNNLSRIGKGLTFSAEAVQEQLLKDFHEYLISCLVETRTASSLSSESCFTFALYNIPKVN